MRLADLRLGWLVIAWGLVVVAVPVHATSQFTITPTFDASITGDPNAAGIEGAIDSAISFLESTYSTGITVPIYFQEGGGLGGSEFFDYGLSYQSYYNALVAADTNPAAIAGLTANGGNSVDNPVTGTSTIDIKSANARALGFNAPAGCIPTLSGGSMHCVFGNTASSVDGIVTLNTSITYPPQANNGSNYGLIAVVEHEIDEILGLGSSLSNTSAGSGTVSTANPAPEDLFRYNASGGRVFGVNCASPGSAFFSYSGATDLAQFNNSCNGADFGDWQSSPIPNGFSAQVQDAFATPGAQPSYGPNEYAALTAIGYQGAVPEPGTLGLMGAGLLTLVGLARRRV